MDRTPLAISIRLNKLYNENKIQMGVRYSFMFDKKGKAIFPEKIIERYK